MTDLPAPTPPASSSEPSPKAKFYAMIFFGVAVLILAAAIAVPGDNSGSDATDSTTTTVYTSAIDPIGEGDIAPVNKYDAYYQHMLDNSGRANTAAKSSVIELGDLVCQSLDEGNSVAAVVKVLADASTDAADMELAAAAVYGAITYLCPEYAANLSAYLNT